MQKRLSLIGDGVGHVAFAGVGLGLLVGVWPVWTALAFAVAGAVGARVPRAKTAWPATSRSRCSSTRASRSAWCSRPRRATSTWRRCRTCSETRYDDRRSEGSRRCSWSAASSPWGSGRCGVCCSPSCPTKAWARVEGLPVDTLGVALAALTAAVIVAGMKVVGLLLIAALMVLPVASAQLLSRSFRQTVSLAAVVGAACAFVGLIIGQVFHLSISGSIVLVAAAVFAIVSLARRSLPAAVKGAA